MKKALTPILAIVAVAAIIFACVFGSQNGSNKAKLDETTKVLDAANASVKNLEAEKEQLTADLEKAKADLDAKTGELETAAADLAAAKADIESKTADLETGKTDMEAKVAELTKAQADLEQGKTDMEAKVAELAQAQADLEQGKTDMEAVKAELAKAQADLEQGKTDMEAVKAELAKAQADLEAKTADLTKAQADLEAGKADMEKLQAELTAAKEELQKKVDELTKEKTDLEGQVAEIQQQLNKTERALTAATTNAYIMFSNADWSVSNWGTADSEDGKVTVNPAQVDTTGQFSTSLEFAEPVEGLAFIALGIKNGTVDLGENWILRVDEIRINGEKVPFLEDKVGYTSSDDGKEMRVNIYNEWVAELPADARVWNGDKAHAAPVIVDKEAFKAVKVIEVDFTVFNGPTDFAYIMYADAAWTKQNWGITDAEDGSVKVKAAEITAAGDYTTSIEFAEPAEGLAFTALGVAYGEITFPGWYLTVKEIRVNGEKIDLLEEKVPYTSSDDGITTRSNLYNEWVSDLPEDARRLDGDLSKAAPVVVDKEKFAKVSKVEIDFNYSPLSAYIMFANGDWSVSNWGYESTDAVKVTPAVLSQGDNNYSTEIAFAEPVNDLAFMALGIKNGEDVLPGWIFQIDGIYLNDSEESILNGIPYTSSDDQHETRSNIYNEWVTDLPSDARTESGNLDNAKPIVIDKDQFKDVKSVRVTFHTVKGQEKAAAAADENAMTKEKADELKANGFNAYIGVQTKSYIFRNTWDEAKYGRDSADNPGFFGRLTGWDEDNNAVDYGGTFADVQIKGDGEYSVKLTTGDMGFGTDDTFRMLFASTDIPSALIKEGYLTIDNVRTKIGDAATQNYTDVDTSGDYARIVVIDEYNRSADPFGYTVPGAGADITITFDVKGW